MIMIIFFQHKTKLLGVGYVFGQFYVLLLFTIGENQQYKQKLKPNNEIRKDDRLLFQIGKRQIDQIQKKYWANKYES